MCGRYELHAQPAAIALAFGLRDMPAVAPRYNIAPMTDVPVVRVNADGERELVMLRWGLVPRAAKDPAIGSKIINARGETVAERASFRMPYRRHRCLLPASGFYEWLTLARDHQVRKQPLHIGMKDGALFGLAGLYERWLGADGEVLDTCTILTTPANALLRSLHDRMPVIIPPEDYARWLDPHNAEVGDLIAAFPTERMTCHPVSMRVNATRNDGPDLIEPVAAELETEEPEPATHVPEQESLF
ncbi:MAG TPA: SOS response-associated peptidase [Casimicrobiaceae bacterium]|nr:SOS response-associated peptidase [Casimicrobiaceae bacterium]